MCIRDRRSDAHAGGNERLLRVVGNGVFVCCDVHLSLIHICLAKVPAIKGLIMDDVITTQNPSTMLKMHEDAVVVIDRELDVYKRQGKLRPCQSAGAGLFLFPLRPAKHTKERTV